MTPARRPPSRRPPVARWLPAFAAVGVLGVVVLASELGSGKSSGSASTATSLDPASTGAAASLSPDGSVPPDGSGYVVSDLTVPPDTVAAADGTVPLADKTQISRSLFQGESGSDVKALQNRLTALGFAPGAADGLFGEQTKEAVWAFEKLILGTPSASATGKVTNTMWLRMQDQLVVTPRRAGAGTHVEIYLPQQVAAVFTDNKATLVIHISSGAAMTSERTPSNEWCETIQVDTDANGNPVPPTSEPVCGVAFTPGGVFRFQRELQGDHIGPLGGMRNPVYFNYGIAMHGAMKVPLTPASHGCVRMNEAISNVFQNFVQLHDLVYVWGWDGKEPESYSKAQSTPVFNFKDPSATTTTVAPTTTAPATTTTLKETTTTVKSTTTTVKATTTTTAKATTTTAPATTVKTATTVPSQPSPTTVPPAFAGAS